jgi:hypothetical protein
MLLAASALQYGPALSELGADCHVLPAPYAAIASPLSLPHARRAQIVFDYAVDELIALTTAASTRARGQVPPLHEKAAADLALNVGLGDSASLEKALLQSAQVFAQHKS